MRRSRTLTVSVALVVLGVAGTVLYSYLRSPRPTPELRGQALARELGCFNCHGPGARGGVPNPGSDEGEVPAWDGGTSMMYVENEDEIREWILYGRPKRLAHEHDHTDSTHVDALVRMPAYESLVSTRELADLVAYYKAVARYDEMPGEVLDGYRVARDNGCFGCHGPGGLVGGENPRSLKGYIPPWRGEDFDELVRDENELRQWIREGTIDRLEKNPLAKFFTRRQIVQMPAYEGRITDAELDAIVRYISWLGE